MRAFTDGDAFVVSTDLQHAILYAGTDREDVVLSRGLSRRYRRAFRRDIATIKFREAHLAKRERPIICAGKSARGDPPLPHSSHRFADRRFRRERYYICARIRSWISQRVSILTLKCFYAMMIDYIKNNLNNR